MKLLFNNKTRYSSMLTLMLSLFTSLHGMQHEGQPLLQSQHYSQPPQSPPPNDRSIFLPPPAYGLNLNGERRQEPFPLGDYQQQEGAPRDENMDRDEAIAENNARPQRNDFYTWLCDGCKERYCCSYDDCTRTIEMQCICCKNTFIECAECLKDTAKNTALAGCSCLECFICFPCRSLAFCCKKERDNSGNLIEKCDSCRIIKNPDGQKYKRFFLRCCCLCGECGVPTGVGADDSCPACTPVSCLTSDECCFGCLHQQGFCEQS